MESQYNYGSAIITPKPTICGVKLLPFCLGHLLLLTETKNPLLSEDVTPVGFQDGTYKFYQALVICSNTYEDGCALLDDMELLANEWNAFNDNLMANMKIDPNWNIYAKVNAFNKYMAYYLDSMPDYKVVSKGDRKMKSGTDWRTSIKVIFQKLNYPESVILNMNMRQLFQEWTANAESEGAIEVLSKFTSDKMKAALLKEKSLKALLKEKA